jgi:glyoxylase-like metal-dependent hydrolase (beta-lactamase superfamily II)
VTDEVWLEPTPGHTPGHVSVRIASRGEEAVITGDMVHHPVQLAEPSWGSHPDAQPERAVDTRRAFVDRYADRDTLVIGTHFSGPSAGWIVRDGDSCRVDVER